MDSAAHEGIKILINEALKQSPHNPESNGFGFATATIYGFCLLLLGVIWFLYRDQKQERRRLEAASKQARIDAAKHIDERFSYIIGRLDNGLNDIETKADSRIGALQGKHDALREEFIRLKAVVEVSQKGGK